MYYVYVLESQSSKKIYIGQTENLEKRLDFHNNSPLDKTSYTHRNPGPWKLIYHEMQQSRQEAIIREKQVKSFRGRMFIKQMCEGR